ncbi:MAG: ATPase synthesis protein 25 mitochondrial [Vezdaea aestivalis]|nr:MAG: ATPase synthesis protein 25 mitochondrial [Vezdaea aestivalis]
MFSTSTVRCKACVGSILDSFLLSNALISRSTISRHPTLRRGPKRPSRSFPTRPFSNNSTLQQNDERSSRSYDKTEVETRVNEPANPSELEKPYSKPATLPWYLQIDETQNNHKPPIDRQQLPLLPKDSPVLLGPLLDYIYDEQGIDNISLFDLRELDRPAALGPNLIMLIGTARSEKHLHSTADRLCRWLRTNYKLSPVADGLLGRNELKLKLRRKARKARLLSNVGVIKTDPEDDGIRTGWVCVNVGRITLANTSRQESQSGNVSGATAEPVTLIVQLMTSEKRDQIDLEGLWGHRLDRIQDSLREDASASTASGAESQQPLSMASSIVRPSIQRSTFAAATELASSQYRGIHTESLRPEELHSPPTTSHTNGSSLAQSDGLQSREHRSLPKFDSKALANPTAIDLLSRETTDSTLFSTLKELESAVGEGRFFDVRQTLLHVDSARLSEWMITAEDAKTLQMRSLNTWLRQLPPDEAIKVLGKGNSDYASSQFLLSFFQLIPVFPNADQSRQRLAMISYAVELGHPKYGPWEIFHLLVQIQLSITEITPQDICFALEALVVGGDILDSRDEELWVSSHSLRHFYPILSIADFAHFPCALPLDETLLVRLVKRLRPSNETPSPTTPGLGLSNKKSKVEELLELFEVYGLRLTPKLYDELLILCASGGHWVAFWNLWYRHNQRNGKKSLSHYRHLLASLAKTKHITGCGDALREILPGIASHPPESYLRLSSTIHQCVSIVDPELEDILKEDPSYESEWTRVLKTFVFPAQRSGNNEQPVAT